MGHYDDCYEYERKEQLNAHIRDIEKSFSENSMIWDYKDKELIMTLMEDKKALLGFITIIKKFSKK